MDTFRLPPPPEFLNESISENFRRLTNDIDETCLYKTSNTLSVLDVLHAHYLIADFFVTEGEGIAGIGPRDLNLVHSAVHRQHVGIGQRRKWEDRFDLCSTLMFGLAMDHAFHDANKRTAFLCCLHQLGRAGRTPTVTHTDFEDFLVEIADHKLDRYPRYKELLKRGDTDPEVTFISKWLRTKTRDVDTRQYTITYRELKRILVARGYDLINPFRNTIDLVSYEKKWRLLRPSQIETKRLMQIGFPGWTRQVARGVLKDVRERLKLTHDHGVDSEVFFRDADDFSALIAHYQDPLRRLAER